jgi:hypothetical protein
VWNKQRRKKLTALFAAAVKVCVSFWKTPSGQKKVHATMRRKKVASCTALTPGKRAPRKSLNNHLKLTLKFNVGENAKRCSDRHSWEWKKKLVRIKRRCKTETKYSQCRREICSAAEIGHEKLLAALKATAHFRARKFSKENSFKLLNWLSETKKLCFVLASQPWRERNFLNIFIYGTL